MINLTEENLTFLLQGRIDSQTIYSVKSIIHNFKYVNEIIISTWEELSLQAELIKTLDPTKIKIVISKDPGSPLRNKKENRLHNVNRIIKSTYEGLKICQKNFVISMRADLFFKSNKIINVYNKFNSGKRILVLNQTTVDPERGPKLLYHCSDWLIMGQTNIIKNYFATDFMPDAFCDWYEKNTKPEDEIDKGNLSRFMAEDYITSNGIINLNYKISHEYYLDFNFAERDLWLSIIGELYIILPMKKLDIFSTKYTNISDFHFFKYLTFTKWKKLSGINVSFFEIFIDHIIYLKRLFLFKLWTCYNKFRLN